MRTDFGVPHWRGSCRQDTDIGPPGPPPKPRPRLLRAQSLSTHTQSLGLRRVSPPNPSERETRANGAQSAFLMAGGQFCTVGNEESRHAQEHNVAVDRRSIQGYPHVTSKFDQSRSTLAQISGPHLPNIGDHVANSGQIWPMVPDPGTTCAESGPDLFNRTRPDSV